MNIFNLPQIQSTKVRPQFNPNYSNINYFLSLKASYRRLKKPRFVNNSIPDNKQLKKYINK